MTWKFCRRCDPGDGATSRDAARRPLILLAAAISFLLSVSLWFSGHELQGIFVGLWVPSILSLGSSSCRAVIGDEPPPAVRRRRRSSPCSSPLSWRCSISGAILDGRDAHARIAPSTQTPPRDRPVHPRRRRGLTAY